MAGMLRGLMDENGDYSRSRWHCMSREDLRVTLESFNIYPRNPPVFPRTKLS